MIRMHVANDNGRQILNRAMLQQLLYGTMAAI